MWAVLSYGIADAQGVSHSFRFICSLMMSSATSQLRLDFHYIKVNFKKSEVIQLVNSFFLYLSFNSTIFLI